MASHDCLNMVSHPKSAKNWDKKARELWIMLSTEETCRKYKLAVQRICRVGQTQEELNPIFLRFPIVPILPPPADIAASNFCQSAFCLVIFATL